MNNNKEDTCDHDIEKGIISEPLNSNSTVVGDNNGNNASSTAKEIDEKGGKKAKGNKSGKKPAKPPRPPRPPRGLSLDSADQKLIRELHELAKLKRARIERMKALKKSKEAKVASSSKNHLFWTLLTLLFCFVLVFQGISSRTNSGVEFQGSPVSSEIVSGISIQRFRSSLASHVNKPGSESQRHVELVSGSESNAPGQGSTAAG